LASALSIPTPRSVAIATDLDVLPPGSIVERRHGYLLVRSPTNPAHYWGNFLVFEEPPGEGDGDRWEALFELEFGDEPRVRHRAFSLPRLGDRLAHFRAGRGAWYVALDPATGDMAASCGIVVTSGRGRFQVVETAPKYRRQGVASRLVVDAARHAAATYGDE